MPFLWWNVLIFFLFFKISVEVFVPLEHRGKRSYTQNRICHAAARNFRLGLVRVSGSLRIQPRCCSYAAVCRCGNGKCWLLRDKGLDSSPRWTQPRKAGTWLDWREKNEHTTLIVLVHELCKWKEEPFSQSLSHSHTVPFFCLLLLSLHRSLIINITALTPANEDEAGICIISPTWWTSPTPDLMRASLVCLLNLTCRRPHTVKRGESAKQMTRTCCRFPDTGVLPRDEKKTLSYCFWRSIVRAKMSSEWQLSRNWNYTSWISQSIKCCSVPGCASYTLVLPNQQRHHRLLAKYKLDILHLETSR